MTVTQVSGNKRHTQKPRLVFNTAATPCSYLDTNRQYLLCTKALGAQKEKKKKKNGFQGPNSCWIFLPCLGPAARKISREKSGQSQQKQAADLAESSFTGLGKCSQTKLRFKLPCYIIAERLQIYIKAKSAKDLGDFQHLVSIKLISWCEM